MTGRERGLKKCDRRERQKVRGRAVREEWTRGWEIDKRRGEKERGRERERERVRQRVHEKSMKKQANVT